ncbi:N-6 DNA methylase [Sphaerisporangium melleum]|nr:N-6 DNA methylase [Sphaerisporangium melleum]
MLLELLLLRLRDEPGWAALKDRATEVSALQALNEFLWRKNYELSYIGPRERKAQIALDLLNSLDALTPPTGDDGWSALVDGFVETASEWLVKGAEHYTPRSVVDLMLGATSPAKDDEVCDPCCGNGGLLASVAGVVEGAVRGHALWNRSARMASLTLALRGRRGEITPDAAPSPEGVERQYRVIMSNPPFNLQLGERPWQSRFGTVPPRNANFAWLCDAYERLAQGGRAAVIMPNGSTFSHGAERNIRAAMVKAGVVERIIALPSGLFVNTGIPVTLWVLRKSGPQNVLMVDGTDLGYMADRPQRKLSSRDIQLLASAEPGKRARLVSLTEIHEQDYNLSPGRYISRTLAPYNGGTLAERFRSLVEAEHAVQAADAHAHEQLKKVTGWKQ